MHDLTHTAPPLQTLVDYHNVKRAAEADKNCTVALRMDVAGFWELMLTALRKADAEAVEFSAEDLA